MPSPVSFVELFHIIFLLVPAFQRQKADVATRGDYISIAYSMGSRFEEKICPGIFDGFRACSAYDLAPDHNLLLVASNFHVSLLDCKE
jgi:hypothetical protein